MATLTKGDNMKPLVIYHDHCTDGFGAAFAAWMKLGDEAEYVPMNYGFKEDETPLYFDREVYMVDFSWPKQLMIDLFNHAKSVVWLDHHKTAFEMWCETEREKHVEVHPLPNNHVIILDNSKSGAMLTWEYFHPEKRAEAWVELIDDRDRWQFKYEGSKPFHTAMQMLKPWAFEKWQRVLEHTDKIVQHGQTLLGYQEHQVESLVKYARKCFIMCKPLGYGVEGLSVNTSVHMSEVGNELANKSGTYGLIWYLGENNNVKCSLRSNGDYDVSAIAKCFGGGGHKNAAGFSVDIQTFLGWLK